MIDRRTLLRGLGAAFVAPMVPALPALLAPATAAAPVAPAGPPLLSFAVGSPDAWDWSVIRARTGEEAADLWLGDQGVGDICEAIESGEETEPCGECEFCWAASPEVVRHAEWDGKPVKAGDRFWCEAGYGAICARCRDEAFLIDDAFINADGKLVCGYCVEPADRLAARASYSGEAGDA